jgi:hypothetical protein
LLIVALEKLRGVCVGKTVPNDDCSACKLATGNDQHVVTLKQTEGEK